MLHRCSEFVYMCVVGDGNPVTYLRGDCCSKFVDESSIFFAENAGVCHTVNFDLTPSRAVRTSSVRMWMAVNKENAMSKQLTFA